MKTKKLLSVIAFLVLLLAAMPVLSVGAGGEKVDVCHNEGDGTFHLINISDNAFDSHVAHGDASPGDPVPGMSGKKFDEACNVVDAGPVVNDGYDATAVKKGQVRYRNFRTQGNGWEFAVGTNVGVAGSMTSVDWTYSANWFFTPDYNTITFVYDGAKVSTTVVANGTTYTDYAEFSTGDLGEVDYMQWLVRGATGQTVDFYDVELTVGGNTYALGDFSQTASTANWNISNFDLSGGFTLTGKIKLTGQSTGDEAAKVDITIGDLP